MNNSLIPFVLSYSAINTYTTCPRKYEGTYVTKETTFESSQHQRFGLYLHKFMEQCAQAQTPPSALDIKAYADNAPELFPYDVTEHLYSVIAMIRDARQYTKPTVKVLTEERLGLTQNGKANSYTQKQGLFRGIADLITLGKREASVYDLKTGKPVRSTRQVEWNAALVLAHYPHIERVHCALWYSSGYPAERAEVTPHNVSTHLNLLSDINNVIQEAYKRNHWPATRNGLCKQYCGVRSCPHNGQYAQYVKGVQLEM